MTNNSSVFLIDTRKGLDEERFDAVGDERRVAAEEYERQVGQQRLKSDLQRRNPNLKVEF